MLNLISYVVARKIIYNYKNLIFIYPQVIISVIISLFLFSLILKKYPRYKLFFSTKYLQHRSYSIFVTAVDYNANQCKCYILNRGMNYSIFDINQSTELLKEYEKLYETKFLLYKNYRIMLGKSKLYHKMYRDITITLYAILILITTGIMVLILLSKPIYIYFLIPHFQTWIDDGIGYLLTVIFPLEIISLVYLIKKELLIWILISIMTIVVIPLILKLPSAPHIYSSFYTVYVYIAILLIINTLLFKIIGNKHMIKISYISTMVTYFTLYFIIIFNLIKFIYY